MKAILYAILALLLCIWYLSPDVLEWKNQPFKTSKIIYNNDNIPINWQGPPYREYVNLKQIPQKMVDAIRTTEDHRFFFHNGIDWIALTRAIKHLIKTGRKDYGASTITMQLARNAFLSPEKTYSRKLKELVFAIKIDALLSKTEIMELYLNMIYFGKGAYGVSAAAWRYYGKRLDKLTLAEQAMIAGIPQAPSKHNPIANPKKALARRNFVLRKLYKHKIINRKTYIHFKKLGITAHLRSWPKRQAV